MNIKALPSIGAAPFLLLLFCGVGGLQYLCKKNH